MLLIPDRRLAIAEAFERARPGDIVLLAGKGHERTILYADRAEPWDEAAAATVGPAVARVRRLRARRARRAFPEAARRSGPGRSSSMPLLDCCVNDELANPYPTADRAGDDRDEEGRDGRRKRGQRPQRSGNTGVVGAVMPVEVAAPPPPAPAPSARARVGQ